MANNTVLVLTQPGDLHAYAVEAALREKGAEVALWQTTQFPTIDGEAIYLGQGKPRIEVDGLFIGNQACQGARGFSSVWCRRPAFSLAEEQLHPSDFRFAEVNCQEFRQALVELLEPDAFWVNSHRSRRQSYNKILQHHAAIEAGFVTPRSLYTNDPARIREFIRDNGGVVAFKPLYALPWQSDELVWMPFTQELREDLLIEDDLLRATPAIYQELVPKAFELRVTVMGNTIFPVRIDSQATERGKVDWRKANDQLNMQPFDLPVPVEQAILRFMRSLGLVFGCLDFIVTPDQRFVFLEVNQAGQFLFVELRAGLPVIDAFAEFLLTGSEDFTWRPSARPFDYAQVRDQVAARARSEAERFVPPPEPCWPE